MELDIRKTITSLDISLQHDYLLHQQLHFCDE
jgi:hypothetical protein